MSPSLIAPHRRCGKSCYAMLCYPIDQLCEAISQPLLIMRCRCCAVWRYGYMLFLHAMPDTCYGYAVLTEAGQVAPCRVCYAVRCCGLTTFGARKPCCAVLFQLFRAVLRFAVLAKFLPSCYALREVNYTHTILCHGVHYMLCCTALCAALLCCSRYAMRYAVMLCYAALHVMMR
jgi:hypothetical protein